MEQNNMPLELFEESIKLERRMYMERGEKLRQNQTLNA